MSISVYEGAIAELEATASEKERLRQYAHFYSFETRVERLMKLQGLEEGQAVKDTLRSYLSDMRSK